MSDNVVAPAAKPEKDEVIKVEWLQSVDLETALKRFRGTNIKKASISRQWKEAHDLKKREEAKKKEEAQSKK